MDDELGMKELRVVNYLTVNRIYIPLSIKQDEQGNIILKNKKDPQLMINNSLSRINYKGEKYDISFDDEGKVSSPIKETLLAEANENKVVVAPDQKHNILVAEAKEPTKEISPTPQKKNVEVALSPLERLSPERQKNKQVDKVA